MDWFIADTHFFHRRVIEYSGRPWDTLEHMTEGLIKNWNARVGKEDRVFVLGDFSFGSKPQIRELVPRLQGKKILIKGNHDMRNGVFYVEAGFASVSQYPMFYTDEAHGITQRFLLSHEPIFPEVGDLINIHGHLHNGVNHNFYAPQHYCVSVEQTDYHPITLPEILRRISERNSNWSEVALSRKGDYDMRRIVREEIVR